MVRRNLSPKTIKRHEQNFRYLKKWLRTRHLNRENLDLFIIYYLKNHKPYTVNSAISTLRCLTEFLFEKKIINEELHLFIRSIRVDPFSPILLTVDEVDQIINCPRSWETYQSIDRQKYDFFFELIARCGLRRGEALSLRFRDFDFENNTLRVAGKGRRVREVPIPAIARDRLFGWFKERLLKNYDYIFQNPSGDQASHAMFTYELKKRLEILGFDKSIHLHTFRHTFITYAARADKNIIKIMKAVGHANIQTTLRYTHLVVEDVRDVIDDHPLNRLPEPYRLPNKPVAGHVLDEPDYSVN